MLARVLVAIPLALSPALRAPAQVFICEYGRSHPHIVIGTIVFRSPISLSPARSLSLRNHILDLTRGMDSQKWAHDLRDEIEELTSEAYQDEGYFKAEVHADLKQTSYQDKRVNLVFNVDPGKQYRLINITFRGMNAFSEDQLAKLIPYEPGSIFNRSKIAAGLAALKRFYDSHGYINFTAIPTPQIDDTAGTLGFQIDIDDGGQFHFGDLEIEGMEETDKEILFSAWTQLHGKAFSQVDADEFFNRFFRSPLKWVRPENYTARHIDGANRLVNYELSLAPSMR